MVNIIVITHGEFGAYLVEAAESIVGPQKGVRCVSVSARLPVSEVSRRVHEAVQELGPGELVVAVDMPGGTPCNVALPAVKELPAAAVVSGVNLYMLVSAFNAREGLDAAALAQRMIDCGRRAVADVKQMLAAKR
ncbi:MAG: hypothetical protein KGL53_03915 [Elusimicrobia bacterium]|nr:hypothetical protein [Elusimicrobiota bacterium]